MGAELREIERNRERERERECVRVCFGGGGRHRDRDLMGGASFRNDQEAIRATFDSTANWLRSIAVFSNPG